MQNFIFRRVDPEETALMEQIYRLRFQVYGRECGFINEEQYPDGLEIDEYDKQSLHFAAIDSEGDVVGTTRLILTDHRLSPLEKYCPHVPVNRNVQPGRYAEISRLAISKNLRKKASLRLSFKSRSGKKKVKPGFLGHDFIAAGLYKELYKESKLRCITHWVALMEKGLWFLLKIYGYKFECLGEEVDVFGPVRPYIGKVSDIERCKLFKK